VGVDTALAAALGTKTLADAVRLRGAAVAVDRAGVVGREFDAVAVLADVAAVLLDAADDGRRMGMAREVMRAAASVDCASYSCFLLVALLDG